MKIVVISDTTYPASPNFYGSEVEHAILADELGKLGNQVTLIAPPKSMKGNYELKYVPCLWGKLDFGIESLVMQYDDILKEADFVIDCSVLKIYCEEVYFFDRERLENQVLVYFENGNFLNPRPPVSRFLDAVVPSETLKNEGYGVKEFMLDPNKIHVIPYGIRTDWYKPIDNPRRNYILYLSACRPEKGIYTILEIAKRLPNEKFVFAWHSFNDLHRENEKKFLAEMKKVPNCKFVDLGVEKHFENKLKMYQNAKALLKPDTREYTEYWGLVSAEAMACGVPVITSKHGANKEVVIDGKTGFLCETVEEYVDAVKSIDKINPEDCRKHVVKNFNPKLQVKKYLELYRRLKND
jgi:glycosyltransferase involved in cell wall biosynthesis